MSQKLKIASKDRSEFIDNFWLNLGDVTKIHTPNIIGTHELFRDNPNLAIIDLMRKPENFVYTCDIILNKKIALYQAVNLKTLWTHPFPMLIGSRGSAKSFSLAMYAILRALFIPGSKIIITGAAFRQAKIIFGYVEAIYRESPMLQDILSHDKSNKIVHNTDEYVFRIGDSVISALPTGSGESIRGKRSSCLICDEFNSINVQVFEEIMQGFGAVSQNPIQAMIDYYKLAALKELGDITEEKFKEETMKAMSNQTIISGTCGYTFEHLYKYWKDYHEIILGRDDPAKMKQLFGDAYDGGFSSKDFAVIRLPYDILPPKFMDEKTISKARATSNSSIFLSEFAACFLSDTTGFFKRTLIEHCVCGKPKSPIHKKCGEVEFTVMPEGSHDCEYVMGVDPAAESDNFAIVILEIHEDHRRIVYTWTTNNANHKAKLKHGMVGDHDYYRYCARKIRDLMKLFNIKNIAIDAQGGGKAIREVLGDPKHLGPGEHPLYPIPDLKKPQLSDHLEGLHILTMVEFSNAEWVYNANHNLKQDMETRELIFPACDSLSFGLLHEMDVIHDRVLKTDNIEMDMLHETSEDILLEVEELKNELVIIEHTKTPNGRDRWDTPKVKGLNAKKGKLRKDRYSALLLANAIGRLTIARTMEYERRVYGGFARDLVAQSKPKEEMHADISKGFSGGVGVKRR